MRNVELNRRPVAGIGMSAGGFDILKIIVSELSSDCLPIALVSHLGDSQQSQMVELLSQHAKCTVRWAETGDRLRNGLFLVAPPGKTLSFQEGRVQLQGPNPRPQFPIDSFFESFSEQFEERAVALVLSGGGSDGSHGIRLVKSRQGIVIAQCPETANFPDMPRNAIRAGVVDEVLKPQDIGRLLAERSEALAIPEEPDALPETTLEQLLRVITEQTGQDFSKYKTPTIIRRLRRRMSLISADSPEAYIERLEQDQAEAFRMARELRIGVTSFFRDSGVWHELAEAVVPALMRVEGSEDTLRIWVTACSSGEEAYTIAAVIAEGFVQQKRPANFQIFATDIDDECLAIAREGIYPINYLARIPDKYRAYFDESEGEIQASNVLRDRIVFSRQDLLQDPPFSKMDIVSCRNLLIYLTRSAQERLYGIFHFSLKTDGYLILGSSESLGGSTHLFSPLEGKGRIYQRRESNQQTLPRFSSTFPVLKTGRSEAAFMPPTQSFDEILHQVLVKNFAPPTVLINENSRIVYFLGETSLFLNLPDGAPNNDLFSLLKPGLAPAIREALDLALNEGTVIRERIARLRLGDQVSKVWFSLLPARTSKKGERYFALSVRTSPAMAEADTAVNLPEDQRRLVQQLNDELAHTRRELESALDQSTVTYEALHARNEEILSMNEELQVSNEELETHKEELQALNEELSTVNSELRSNVSRLEKANNDLSNFVSGSDSATLFLDSNFRIQQFTPAIQSIYKLSEMDIGRALSVFSSEVIDPELFDDAKAVLSNLQRKEKEVESRTGQAYLRRLSPYRTREGNIEGVVLNYSDITELVKVKKKLSRSNQDLEKTVENRTRELNTLLENAPDVIVRFDLQFRHIYANRKAEEVTGYSRSQLIGKTNRDLGMPKALVESWEETKEKCLRSDSTVQQSFEYDGKYFDTRIVPEHDTAGNIESLLCITREMTELREAERESLALREKLEQSQRLDQLGLMAGGIAHDFNNLLVGILGPTSLALELLPKDSPVRQDLKMVQEAGRRARDLARRMLAYAGRATVQSLHLNPYRELQELVPLLGCLFQNNSSLETDLKEVNYTIRLDSAQLHEALTNLVVNASESYGEQGGVVRLKLREEFVGKSELETFDFHHENAQPGSYLVFEVSDQGEGMSAEVRNSVLTPFFTTKDGGRGLGLPMVVGFVRAHGGLLRMRSEEGKGTSFELYISTQQAEKDAGVKKKEPLADEAPRTLLSGDVMVVDDEVVVRKLLTRILKNLGFDVAAANSGEECLDIYDVGRFKILFLDLNMPGIGGEKVLEKVLSLDPEQLVLISSGFDRQDVADQIPVAPNIGFLPKPYQLKQVRSAIDSLLKKN